MTDKNPTEQERRITKKQKRLEARQQKQVPSSLQRRMDNGKVDLMKRLKQDVQRADTPHLILLTPSAFNMLFGRKAADKYVPVRSAPLLSQLKAPKPVDEKGVVFETDKQFDKLPVYIGTRRDFGEYFIGKSMWGVRSNVGKNK